jgi:hypothetical protein
MKYYDRDLQDAWNTHPTDRRQIAQVEQKARLLRASYFDQLARLRPRLSARAYSLFSKEKDPLFDSNILSFTVGDGMDMLATDTFSFRFRTGLELKLLNFDMDTVYSLSYREVRSMSLNLPDERWYGPDDDFGSLLAHEVTAAGLESLRHEFLFTSGATIAIKFKKVLWSKRAVRRK